MRATASRKTSTGAGGQRKRAGARSRAQGPAADQKIYDSLFDAVMGHRLPPGTKITEASLCELFKVSRTTVRKVLQRLAHENIIELKPNRGASVASPSPQETHEIFAARRVIEAAIVPLVAGSASAAQIVRLRRHVKSEHAALAAGERSRWIRLTGGFHLELAEVAGNRILLRVLTELVSRCSLIIALYDSPVSLPCADGEHEQLIELIADGNAVRAARLIDQHLLAIERRLQLETRRDAIDLADILSVS